MISKINFRKLVGSDQSPERPGGGEATTGLKGLLSDLGHDLDDVQHHFVNAALDTVKDVLNEKVAPAIAGTAAVAPELVPAEIGAAYLRNLVRRLTK